MAHHHRILPFVVTHLKREHGGMVTPFSGSGDNVGLVAARKQTRRNDPWEKQVFPHNGRGIKLQDSKGGGHDSPTVP